MLSGVYGYFFGEENSNDSTSSVSTQENAEPCSVSSSEDDWCIVEDNTSGRSSPVLVPNFETEVRDIDSLSFCSRKSSIAALKRAAMDPEREAKLAEIRRTKREQLELEAALFAHCDTEVPEKPGKSMHKSALITATKLKRTNMVATEERKGKSRSKKTAKNASNVNNNRKCQNLD